MPLLLKNKINIEQSENNNNDNYTLLQFILNVINAQYDYSFFQQIMNIIIQHNEMCSSFINCIIEKVFKGRNINIKINDIKMIFRYCITSKSIELFDLINKLLNCLKPKNSSGARTIHQAGQAVVVISYLLEYVLSKGKGEDIKEDNIINVFNSVKKVLEEYLNSEEEDNKDNNENLKRKRKYFGEIKKMLSKFENVKGKGNMNDNVEFTEVKNEVMRLYENEILHKFSIIEDNKEQENKEIKKDEKGKDKKKNKVNKNK